MGNGLKEHLFGVGIKHSNSAIKKGATRKLTWNLFSFYGSQKARYVSYSCYIQIPKIC